MTKREILTMNMGSSYMTVIVGEKLSQEEEERLLYPGTFIGKFHPSNIRHTYWTRTGDMAYFKVDVTSFAVACNNPAYKRLLSLPKYKRIKVMYDDNRIGGVPVIEDFCEV